jgi:phage terminase large subunit-like protein
MQQEALAARTLWLQGGKGVEGREDQMPPSEKWLPDHIAPPYSRADFEAGRCREEQIGTQPPSTCTPDQVGQWREDWFFWLLMAGRGAGKTRTGAEDAWWYGFLYPGCRYAVVAPTNADCRKTCFEGESGLIARVPPTLVANWNRGEMVLTLTNGSMFQGYSADEPDRLRGPQHHRAWCDELAAWRYLDDTLDNLLMGLRLGPAPRIVATTTPRPLKRLKEIVADETTRVQPVSTYANLDNLPRLFREKILKRYEGTRLGRQELHAEILTDNPGALWQRTLIDELRIKEMVRKGVITLNDGRTVNLVRIVVGVDPASGGLGEDDKDPTKDNVGDECGIVVAALGDDGRAYVLADCTVAGATPGEWGAAVVRAYDEWKADRVIYEANQGGEMVRHTVVTSAKALRDEGERSSDFVPTEAVWASRGKVTRAEPVSALYEQKRVSHVGTHATLEDQMCEFTANFDRKRMGYSPDRVDALVWAITHLKLNDDAGLNVQDFYRQESNEHKKAMESRQQGLGQPTTGELVRLIPPEGSTSNTVFGMLGNMYTLQPDGHFHVHLVDVEPLTRAGYTHPVTEETN